MPPLRVRENLCALPFMHLSTKPDGAARICCASDSILKTSGGRPLRLGENSLREIWNSAEIKSIRQKMLRGEKLKICRACWSEERAGKKSKRVLDNQKYLKAAAPLLEEARQNSGHIRKLPSFLDLRLGNLCNLKCRTCSPLFSSAWRRELERHSKDFPKDSLRLDTLFANFEQGRIGGWHKTDLFFRDIKESAGNLKVLYISGGEPALMKEWLKILGSFIETGDCRHIAIRLNSNITKLPPAFMESLLQFPDIEFGASIDAFGEKNSWLRPPSRWAQIAGNMERLMEMAKKHKNLRPYILCTVSVFNALYLGEIIDFARQLSKKFQTPEAPEVSLNIVHMPDFQSLTVLPKPLKRRAIEGLKDLAGSGRLFPSEAGSARAVIYMLEASLEDSPKIRELRGRLKKHILLIDKWRGEDFFSVFPEFKGEL